MQVKKQQLEPYMEQPTGSKIGKGKHQSCILSSCLLNLYADYLCKMPDLMNHKLESRLPGEISTTSDMRTISLFTAESEEKLKSLLIRVKEEHEKAG